MTKTPTKRQITAQVTKLKEIAAKPTFRKTTMFGDRNDEAIQAQIEVLEKRLPEGEIFDREDSGMWPEHVSTSARDAAAWLWGDSTDKPADGWEGLY